MRPVLDSIRRTISSPCSKSYLSSFDLFSALRDIRGEPSAFMSMVVHAHSGRFGAMFSLDRLLAASMAIMWYHSSLGCCRCFLFLDIFTVDARSVVVVSVYFVADACCDTLGNGAIVLPLTFFVANWC